MVISHPIETTVLHCLPPYRGISTLRNQRRSSQAWRKIASPSTSPASSGFLIWSSWEPSVDFPQTPPSKEGLWHVCFLQICDFAFNDSRYFTSFLSLYSSLRKVQRLCFSPTALLRKGNLFTLSLQCCDSDVAPRGCCSWPGHWAPFSCSEHVPLTSVSLKICPYPYTYWSLLISSLRHPP
jgi:hypothetical protein